MASKTPAHFPCRGENIGLAVGEVVGHSSMRSPVRINSALIGGESEWRHGDRYDGEAAEAAQIQSFSNVPPFITHESLSREICRHGKVVSPEKRIRSGCKSTEACSVRLHT